MANCKYSSAAVATLFISVLLIASVAESQLIKIGFGTSGLTCAKVYGAEQNDTCISVGQKFKLEESAFLAINPNINCDKIFVGQWLCVQV